MLRKLGVHFFLLATSIAVAFNAWKGKPLTSDLPRGEIVIWKSKAEDIQRIVYEAPTYKTTIEAKHDAGGAYFTGKYERTIAPGEEVSGPDNIPQLVNTGDKPLVTSQIFISTKAGLKLVKDLSRLKALVAVGRVSKNQLHEFGLDAPKTRAIVTFGSAPRTLEFGDETLGEKNRYVLDAQTQAVYVLLGDLARDISLAHERLPDRDLHAWHETLPTSARVTGLNRTRNLARGSPKGSLFWADSASPSTKDVTATNWMTKVEELRAIAFDPSPANDRRLLLRIDYAQHGSQQGFLELWKVDASVVAPTGAAQKRSQYWVRTEQTRLLAQIFVEQGEQIEQNAKSILK